MQTQTAASTLTGSYDQNNYVWAIAMNLAWNELLEKHLTGDIRLESDKDGAQELFNKFNQKAFSKDSLNIESYYASSGMGQETVNRMTKEVEAKFPGFSPELLKNLNIGQTDLISFGYLNKQFAHKELFEERQMTFMGKQVKGFAAGKQGNKGVEVLMENDQDNFILRLSDKASKDEIYLIKGFESEDMEEVFNIFPQVSGRKFPPLEEGAMLMIPNLQIDYERSYKPLVGGSVYHNGEMFGIITQMDEKLKFKLDYTGASVVNEAVVTIARGLPPAYIFDKPFRLLMKEKNQLLPYLILHIKNTAWMDLL